MVVVEWAGVRVVSCYISPNAPHAEFLEFVDDLEAVVHQLEGCIIVGGDFNSKSTLWGCARINARRGIIEEWAAECDLRIVNTGSTPTCVKPQGCSVIDLTWSTLDILGNVSDWRVRQDVETLSDHEYITMCLNSRWENEASGNTVRPRWNWRTLNEDIFHAALSWELEQPALFATGTLDSRIKKVE